MMVFKKKINIHTIKYISVSYINVALNIIINLILINKVSSYDLGRISIGKTIFQSFEFTHVGIRNGFDRIFPNINNEAEKNEIFQVGLITTLFFSICFFLFWSVYKFNSIIFYSFFTLSGVIYSLVMLFRVYYRSFSDKKKFVKLSAIAILLPSLSELFGFIIYGIHGYLLGFILSYLIILFFVLTKYAIPLKSKFSGLRFGHALKMVLDKGLLLFVSGLITFFATSADRLLIEQYWGLDAVGRFTVIMFFFSVFGMFSVNYTEMIMSNIISSKSFKYALKHMLYIFIFMILLSAIAYVLLPFLITIFMNQYKDDISLMRIIIFAAIPYSMRSILYYYMHAIDKRKILLIIDLFSTIIYFVILFFILKHTSSFELIMFLKIGYYMLSILSTGFFAFHYSKKIKLFTYEN